MTSDQQPTPSVAEAWDIYDDAMSDLHPEWGMPGEIDFERMHRARKGVEAAVRADERALADARLAALGVALVGALRLAAFEMDKNFPNDPDPEAQTDLRGLAAVVESGGWPELTSGMARVFSTLAGAEGRAALSSLDSKAGE